MRKRIKPEGDKKELECFKKKEKDQKKKSQIQKKIAKHLSNQKTDYLGELQRSRKYKANCIG